MVTEEEDEIDTRTLKINLSSNNNYYMSDQSGKFKTLIRDLTKCKRFSVKIYELNERIIEILKIMKKHFKD